MHLHLWTVLPCVPLGLALFFMRKGTQRHRRLGGIYMGLMLFTATVALFMPARTFGYKLFGHFGWIHSFSVLTIVVIPFSLRALRRGNVRRHKIGMVLLYVGALIIAGGFTLVPGRYLHGVLFGN